MNRSISVAAATSVRSSPSLNLAHNTTSLSPHIHDKNTQPLQDKSMRMMAIMLMLLIIIVIVIVIANMTGNSHWSCTFTSALFDMRSSTVDTCPPRAAK
jgi:ABC-type phosphate transport system permease subunit